MTTKQRISLTLSTAVTGLIIAAAALADSETPPSNPCDPVANAFKNHGGYVSCIAHQELPGNGQIISDAAQSDIGQ